METLLWILAFVVLVPVLVWFRKATTPPPEPAASLPPEQVAAAAALDAYDAWLEAYRALPPDQQALHREEFHRRFLDSSERLLQASALVGIDSKTPELWVVRRVKQLLASGMSFNDASTLAVDEMEQRFPERKSW
jgi:hypothetical protein